MKHSTLRMTLFLTWLTSWLLANSLLIAAPALRKTSTIHVIATEEIGPALLSISTIWLPPLSCFCGFWFPSSERQRGRDARVGTAKAVVAFTITGFYLSFV